MHFPDLAMPQLVRFAFLPRPSRGSQFLGDICFYLRLNFDIPFQSILSMIGCSSECFRVGFPKVHNVNKWPEILFLSRS